MNLAIIFLLAGFFCWSGAPGAKALSSTNASAEIVIGQADMTGNSANRGNASPDANTTNWPNGSWTDGKKLIVADIRNNRVLIFNDIPTSSNASANVVIGQQNMTSNSSSTAANTFNGPYFVSSDGIRLFVADTWNNRVLIYNTIPTSNNASADVVIGQADMSGGSANRGGSVAENTLNWPMTVHTDGTKLFIADSHNHRILIYNTIPTTNGANADVVVGQQDMASADANRGGSVAANTLDNPSAVFTYNGKMYVTDAYNNRVLIFNSVPVSNNASADIAVGQTNLNSNETTTAGNATASKFYTPFQAATDGVRLFVSEYGNSRVLIFNSLPTSSGASADTVIGQTNFSNNFDNQGGAVGANTLRGPGALYYASGKLIVSDVENHRTLIYSLDAPYTLRNKRSQRFSANVAVKLKKTTLTFGGRKTGLGKKGRVQIFQNGVLRASKKMKKNGKWTAKVKQSQMNVNRLFQLRYYNSSGAFSGVSDQYNVYLNRASKSARAVSAPEVFVSPGGSARNSVNFDIFGVH